MAHARLRIDESVSTTRTDMKISGCPTSMASDYNTAVFTRYPWEWLNWGNCIFSASPFIYLSASLRWKLHMMMALFARRALEWLLIFFFTLFHAAAA
jgi:hypothetical protein